MTYFKKIHVALTLLLITSISSAYGDYDQWSGYGAREDCFSCQEDCFCCQPECCGNGFISAELLYWRAFENGLDTCVPTEVSDVITSDGTVISRFTGKSRDPHFKWDPGFRIGAGYQSACSCWDTAVFWTHFHSHAHSSNHGLDIQNKTRWNINLDVIDYVLGYDCDLCSCLALRPFVGIRGARIEQKLHVDEFSIESIETGLIALERHNKERFFGVGPLLGFEADWNIGCNFSIYGSAAISWLYGSFHVKLRNSDVFIGGADFSKIKKHLHDSLAGADAALGVRWHTCICTNKVLVLQAGLEHHRYFDYNRFGTYGDLSFDGVNFSAGIQY